MFRRYKHNQDVAAAWAAIPPHAATWNLAHAEMHTGVTNGSG